MQKTKTEKQTNPIETLKEQLMEAEQKELESISRKVDDLQNEHQATIGIQLDIRKLTDIIAFMIANNKPVISLKYEVWKSND